LYLKLGQDERFDPCFTRQAQTEQAALTLQINMKIEEGATLALGDHPFRELSQGNRRWTVLKFVSLARRNQLVRSLFVTGALGRIQRLMLQ
jgi:hypothetical protein